MKALAILPLIALAVSVTPKAFAVEVGDTAPSIALNDVQTDDSVVNQSIETRATGTSYTMLEFFSTTCSGCAANLPIISQLSKDVAATTTTRFVGLDRDATATQTYIDGHRDQISFPVSVDSDRAATKAFGILVTPTIFVLDSNNKVIFKLEDVFQQADIDKVKSLVAAH